MKKLLWLLLAIPMAVLLIVFSVANRAPVTMLLDPFSSDNPALAVTLPFFGFIFTTLLVGMISGAVLTWLGQGRHRKAARQAAAQARIWQHDAEAQKNRAEALAAAQTSPQFPAISNRAA